MSDSTVIENATWRVGLLPRLGGSVAFGQVRVKGEWVDVMRPTPPEPEIPKQTASYPLVPWSNRIGHALLRFAGREYQLRANWPDGSAIHGAGWDYPWTVVEHTGERAVLEFVSHDVYGVNWPWSFTARFSYALEGDDFVWTYGVQNTSHETFPAGFGHHPYLLRSVAGSADAVLQVAASRAFTLEDSLPTGPAGPVRPEADFRTPRPLGRDGVDDCLTGRTDERLAVIEWPETVRLEVLADAALQHAVLYIPAHRDYWALEPVSNANDGFTLDAEGIEGTGVFLLQPGETRTASFRMRASALA